MADTPIKTEQQGPQGASQTPQEAPGATQTEADQSFAGTEKASTGETDALRRVVLAGTEALYSESTSDAFVQMLEGGKDDPEQAIADTTTMLVTQLDDKANREIPEVVILPAVRELAPQVAELGESAGVFHVEQQQVDRASSLAVSMVSSEYGVTPKDGQNFMAGVDKATQQQIVAQQQKVLGGG